MKAIAMTMTLTLTTMPTIIPVLEPEGAVQWAPTVRGSDVSLLTEFLASQV
uniref:Uncharacterized protein n=1 Tax=Anguilla anguilla TaxID=7936 RepID=A0A0E9XZ11_ANGAN